MKLKTLHMFSDFYNSMQEIIEIQKSKSKLKFDLLEQKNKIPKIKQNNRINSGKKIEPSTKYLLTQLDENFLQNAIMANNTLKIRQIGVNSIHRKKTKPNDQIKINKNYNYDLSNIKANNRIQSESDHNKNRQKIHINSKKNSTQQIILQKEKKTMSIKSQINKTHVQIIQRNPSTNQLQIDDKFNNIDCNNVLKLYKNSNIVQKNNLVIINFWGLLASNTHFFQLESNFQKQINLCLNFEKGIQQLIQNCNLVFILKKNNNNKQLQRILKQNQCDLIFQEIEQNKIFIDCSTILSEFEKQFQSIYYFSCLDTQFKMENKQLNLLNKNAFKGKIPKLCHDNFYILYFQNIVFQNQNILNNQNVLIQILKFLQGQSNSIQKLDNLMQILKIQQDKIKKDDIQKKIEQKMLEIKKINKINNSQANIQIRVGLQESIYNQFKADAQKRKIQVFFSYIGDLLLKNQSIDLSYHKNNKQLINQLSQIDQQIFVLSDQELEQNYLTLIINKIYFDIV